MKGNHQTCRFNLLYLSLGVRGVFGVERRCADDHLVEDDPDAPPVAELRVAGLQQDLGGDVVGRAHERVRRATQLLFPRSPLQWFHSRAGNGRARTLAELEIQGARIHGVLTDMTDCYERKAITH